MSDDFPWRAHYDPGVPHTLDYPEMPFHNFLEQAALNRPEAICTRFRNAQMTYIEVNTASDRFAAGLASTGVKKGTRVGILLPNCPQFVISFFAILKLGGIVVAVNPLFTPPEIKRQVNDAGVTHMIVITNAYDKVKALQPETGINIVIPTNIKEALPPVSSFLFTLLREKKDGYRIELSPGDHWMQALIDSFSAEDRPSIPVTPDDRALIQYSGGTTGTPKGAVALHRNLVANVLQFDAWMTKLEHGKEVFLLAIPMYHVYGMVAGMGYGIASQNTLVLIANPRDFDSLLKQIEKNKVSYFPGVPTIYNAINNHPDVLDGKYDLKSIKVCISGSAPLLRETKETFEALTGGVVFEGYGLSEAPTATHINPVQGLNKEGSIGLPLPDVEVRILDIDDGLTVLPKGQPGEMVLRGPQVMFGYHNMPTETYDTLREGWLFTGDIATMDADGYFFITDRKKELIKPGGLAVWPREVEEVLQSHPQVKEVGVAGVPDEYRGETVKAWCVLKDGETTTQEALREYCRESLAAYKIPTEIVFVDHLPKSTVGKILRRELIRMHEKQANEKHFSK